MGLQMSAAEVEHLLDEIFPQVKGEFSIENLAEMTISVRLNVGERHLRPGGTVSGPSLFALADCAVYMIILAMVGPEALAVTTNSSIDFMRKPQSGRDLIAECKLLKLGRTLAVGDVLIYSEGTEAPVARANMTYSLPPKR